MQRQLLYPFLLLFSLLFGASCERSPFDSVPEASQPGGCALTLRFEPDEMRQADTRAADENAVRDINLWACGTGIGRGVHLYVPGGKTAAALTLIPDNYRFYAVANAGRDLGDMAEAALQTLAVPFSG